MTRWQRTSHAGSRPFRWHSPRASLHTVESYTARLKGGSRATIWRLARLVRQQLRCQVVYEKVRQCGKSSHPASPHPSFSVNFVSQMEETGAAGQMEEKQ